MVGEGGDSEEYLARVENAIGTLGVLAVTPSGTCRKAMKSSWKIMKRCEKTHAAVDSSIATLAPARPGVCGGAGPVGTIQEPIDGFLKLLGVC